MDSCYIIIIITFACLFILIFNTSKFENFQIMNYIQMHNHLDNKYGNRILQNGYNGNGYTYNNGYMNNYTYHNGFMYNNRENNLPRLIGYIYSQDENNNETYQLYEMFDYKRGKLGYVYKDSKYQDRDSVLVVIDPKLYNGDLYDGAIVNIGPLGEPYVIKLYDIKNVGLGTRYMNKDFHDEMEGYGLLRPIDPGNILLEEDDKYFILYRQTLDPRRNRYNYYIKDKRGSLLELDNNKYKELDDGDMVLIPGKERHGKYILRVYNQ